MRLSPRLTLLATLAVSLGALTGCQDNPAGPDITPGLQETDGSASASGGTCTPVTAHVYGPLCIEPGETKVYRLTGTYLQSDPPSTEPCVNASGLYASNLPLGGDDNALPPGTGEYRRLEVTMDPRTHTPQSFEVVGHLRSFNADGTFHYSRDTLSVSVHSACPQID